MKTFSPRPRDIERRWYVVDANGAVLGRLASHVASILRGKHKPIYAPHADTGDHVIVVNARGVRVTGGKEFEKIHYSHSGYPGGLRKIRYDRLLSERPAVAVEKAIGGMLPKNRLGRQMLGKLSVYEGPDHPHQAQKPLPLTLGEFPRWEGLPKPKPTLAPSAPVGAGQSGDRGPSAHRGRRGAAAGRRTGPAPARKARSGVRATAKASTSTSTSGRGQASSRAGGGRRAAAGASAERGPDKGAPRKASTAVKAASSKAKAEAEAGGEEKKTRRTSRRKEKES